MTDAEWLDTIEASAASRETWATLRKVHLLRLIALARKGLELQDPTEISCPKCGHTWNFVPAEPGGSV